MKVSGAVLVLCLETSMKCYQIIHTKILTFEFFFVGYSRCVQVNWKKNIWNEIKANEIQSMNYYFENTILMTMKITK